MSFDFIDHNLYLRSADGSVKAIGLFPRSVAEFYHELMGALGSLGIAVTINPMPQEVPDPVPCDVDDVHDSYDPQYAHRFWRVLLQADRVFTSFRSRFVGKCSPVHFFWGSCDLAVTRFSGRRAPRRAGADRVTREAYSHEVSSCGFWPGSGAVQRAAFYSYAAPEPADSRRRRFPGVRTVRIPAGRVHPGLRRGAAFEGSGFGALVISPKHLRCRSRPGRLGQGRAGAAREDGGS